MKAESKTKNIIKTLRKNNKKLKEEKLVYKEGFKEMTKLYYELVKKNDNDN